MFPYFYNLDEFWNYHFPDGPLPKICKNIDGKEYTLRLWSRGFHNDDGTTSELKSYFMFAIIVDGKQIIYDERLYGLPIKLVDDPRILDEWNKMINYFETKIEFKKKEE